MPVYLMLSFGSYLVSVLGFIFVFGLVVLIHELGHFVFAKYNDVQVDAFSIGMGPALASFRKGETEYKLAPLPVGGYVSLAGEDPEEAGDNPRAFYNKGVGVRTLILLAGCIFNFLLGYGIYVGLGMTVGETIIPPKVGSVDSEKPAHGKLRVGDKIVSMNGYKMDRYQDIRVRGELLGSKTRRIVIKRNGEKKTVVIEPEKITGEMMNQERYIMGIGPYLPPKLGTVKEDGRGAELGFQEGDRFTAVNGKPVNSWLQLQERLKNNRGEVTIAARRDGETIRRTLQVPEDDKEFKQWAASFKWGPPNKRIVYGPLGALKYGLDRTIHTVKLMYEAVAGLISQTVSPQSLAGPIGITQMTSEVSQRGFIPLLAFTAFFSINLGVLNLLPIPALDGGHILLTLPEIFTGNPLPDRVVSGMNYIGIVLLLTLLVYVTKIDLCRYEWFSDYMAFVCH
ncbi:MAG: RIP metalloprotease RseP [bacterium]